MEGGQEFRWYLSVIGRRLWLVIICALVAAIGAFLVSSWIPPVYRASTSIMAKVGGGTDTEYAAVMTSRLLAATYTELLLKRPVIEMAAQNLGIDPQQIEEKVQVRLIPETLVIELTAEDDDPRMAVEIANGMVDAFMQVSRESGSARGRDLVVVEPATMSQVKDPVWPRTPLNTALAAVVGAALAVGAAFLVEYLDDTIRTPADVEQSLGLNALGVINQPASKDGRLVVVSRPSSPAAEAFHALCTNIRFSHANHPLQTLLVTSPDPAAGKSVVVANLATAMAQAGLNAVVLDADLRHPWLHQLFGLDQQEGLAESLLEGAADGRLQPTQVEGLRLLPGGRPPSNPVGAIGSPRMQKLLAGLAQQADITLIDSPPVLPVTDAAVLAGEVDGVLLVLEAGRSRRKAARDAAERLQRVGANLIGVVLVVMPSPKMGHYKHHADGGEGRKRRLRRSK